MPLKMETLPTNLSVGDVCMLNGQRVVRTHTGGAQVPHTVTDLETVGKRHGWGVLTEMFCDSYGPVIFVSVGRNSGVTKNGEYVPGITYRLRWDCAQKGKEGTFVLISRYYRSTETHGSWVKHAGTLYDIHHAMKTAPVILRGEVITDA